MYGSDQLSPREMEVLTLVADGLSNKQIGDRLCLAEKTVAHYMTTILSKLGVRSRVEAAVLAYRLGCPRCNGLFARERCLHPVTEPW